jgi:hypothetical protein
LTLRVNDWEAAGLMPLAAVMVKVVVPAAVLAATVRVAVPSVNLPLLH